MSVAYLLESPATTKDGERRAPIISPTAEQTGNNRRDDDTDGDRAESTLPTVLPPRSPSSAAAATPVCTTGNLSGNEASDAPRDTLHRASGDHNRGSGVGPDSTPTSTRSAHKPAVLSLSLRSLEIDTALPDVPPTAAPAGGNETEQAAAPAATTATPVTHTSAVKAVPYDTPTRTTEPAALSVPMLQLPIKPIKDEVTPVKTLYSRLFHEAQQREQRQTQAQRRQRAAQQAEERQRCTFHPRGADAFAVSPSGKQKRTSVSEECKGQTPKRASNNSAATPPHAASPSSTSKAAAANSMNRSTASAAEEETAACERLYHNAEQSERRARRLQQLREAQEEEFRNACTFRPCVTPTKAGRQRSMSRSEDATALAASTAESPGKESTGAAATSPRNAARSWEHFLADQEERQAIHERRLADLKKRVAEQEHAALYTGVPRSKASEHLKKYLEKKKGYKGPIEGWSERFDHYMKVKQEAEAAAAPACAGGSRSRARSGGSGAAPRSASIFHRLYHDSDEREAMRELIRMMREQQEQTAFFKPNAGGNGAAAGGSPRTPRQSHSPVQHDADAALETAAAVAVAAGGQEEADDAALQQQHGNSKTIFDTLYAEKEKLQRRRELRHVQAQNTAEVYSFRPHVSSHSRELAKEVARMKASGQHVETVRERRARLAAEAQAEKAAREAQIHFRYDSFARRQAERDRRREDELLQLLLQERSEDVEACRFRPAISHVTEAIVEGNKNYAQLIDDPSVVHELVARQGGGGGGPSSASAARSVPHDSGAQRASFRKASSSQPAVGERAQSSSSAPARRAGLTPVQALAAGAEALHERSHDAVTESQMQDAFSAPYHTHSMASSSSGSSRGSARQELEWAEQQEGKSSSPSMANANVAEKSDSSAFVHREAEKTQANGDSLGTVHIAGAASSTYLRQLESELQDALKEWSQCM